MLYNVWGVEKKTWTTKFKYHNRHELWTFFFSFGSFHLQMFHKISRESRARFHYFSYLFVLFERIRVWVLCKDFIDSSGFSICVKNFSYWNKEKSIKNTASNMKWASNRDSNNHVYTWENSASLKVFIIISSESQIQLFLCYPLLSIMISLLRKMLSMRRMDATTIISIHSLCAVFALWNINFCWRKIVSATNALRMLSSGSLFPCSQTFNKNQWRETKHSFDFVHDHFRWKVIFLVTQRNDTRKTFTQLMVWFIA